MTLTIIRGNGETGATGSTAMAGGRVQNAIASASASTGVDFKYLYKQAGIESGYNANAQATTSSASGLYQFTNQTWLGVIKAHGAEHGLSWAANAITRDANGHYSVTDPTTKQEILALRQSPETSAAMAGEYASDNKAILQAKLGRDANPTDLYMAHFLGPAGATRFLKAKDADPDQSAASVMPAAARANKWVFYDKSGNPRSLSDVYQRFASRFDQSAPASGGSSTTTTLMASRTTDSSADLLRMQLAALNGTNDGTTIASSAAVTSDPTNMTAAAVLTPSPQTARLAYLMLASLGVLMRMATTAINKRVWMDAGRGAIMPIAALMLVALMVVPMPAIMLDLGFITNIVISLAVLMVALNAAKPLDFSAFPTVLLFTTLLRLSLNVASTRVVLVHGHEGAGAAGHVIEAFGSFLIGGNYAVGIFVFAIIMIINLVVITKGAGRVSEVSARFTLDAMPGKQMAIDADLNAGLLTPDAAKARRQEVATEADFYGSMDGASKFVKGDAVAGVLVLAVNVLGGLILGVASHHMAIGDAAKDYVQLAIGDALVAQIPALLLSIAAASIVTRVSSPLDLGGQIASQFGSAKAWTPVAAILTILGVLPGMPHVIMLPAAALCGFVAWKLRGADQLRKAEALVADKAPAATPANPSAIGWNEVSDDAPLGLEIGYGLVSLVDERKGAPLMARITGIRRQLSKELGFVIPLVRVRDNMNLAPNAYRITVAGVVVGEDECHPADLLALDSGDLAATVAGRAVKDPTFGLDAVWIAPDKRGEAVVAGYTVVDPSTVLATHLNQLIINSASDLFGMDETQKLLDELKEKAPQLVAGLTPAPLSLAQIASACRALLSEGVPLKDFRRVAEAMTEAARDESDPVQLVEQVRRRIGALIVQTLVPVRMPLPVVTLDAQLESLLTQAVRTGPNASHPIEPALAGRIVAAVSEAAGPLVGEAKRFAIVTSPIARRALGRLLRPHLPDAPVLSFLEIPDGKAVEVVAVVGGQAPQVTQQRREPEMAR